MGYKFSKLRFGESEIFKIVVNDLDGREIDKFTINKKDFPEVARRLIKKYGLNAKVIIKNYKNKEENKDLSWLPKY